MTLGPLLSRSVWLKLVALLVAIVSFVLLYETRMLDSQYAAWQSMLLDSPPPPPGSRLSFSATAYCKGSTTASGVTARTGVAAADPAMLPVGSVVNVAADDIKYNGVYTVMDTGPQVQGRVLDLYMWSCHEAQRFGRKEVQVTVLRLGWDPQASSPRLIDRLFRRREAQRRIPAADPPPPSGVPPAAPAQDRVDVAGDGGSPASEAAGTTGPGRAGATAGAAGPPPAPAAGNRSF